VDPTIASGDGVQIPLEVRNLLQITNNYLAHLDQTDQFDEDIPSNMTQLQRRGFYVNGQMPQEVGREQRRRENVNRVEEVRRLAAGLATATVNTNVTGGTQTSGSPF
jgi:hypothetical protein